MSDQWFVHSNGEQIGPYTGEQLVQYAQEGSITAETMVWAEGMPEWAPASQVPGLIPEAPAPQPAAVAQPAAAWAPPGSRLAKANAVAATGAAAGASYAAASPYAAQAPVGGEYPYFPMKSASFGLWMGTFLGGFVLFFIAIIMLISGAVKMASSVSTSAPVSEITQTTENEDLADSVETPEIIETVETTETLETMGIDESAAMEAGAASLGMAGILYFISLVVLLISGIFFCINLYRAWACLQPGRAQTTPGKAVGFMFIPLFNIYWIFVAINGLPKDWNRIVASYEDLKAAPKLNETTFLLYCIGIFFAPLALIMIFPMMSQLCKGINFFASRRNPNAPTTAFSAFGGR